MNKNIYSILQEKSLAAHFFLLIFLIASGSGAPPADRKPVCKPVFAGQLFHVRLQERQRGPSRAATTGNILLQMEN
jgi:hypothetical protein